VHRQGQSPHALRIRCKVSIATPVTKPKGGQFVLHARALHGNPYDGHTLAAAVAEDGGEAAGGHSGKPARRKPSIK
jgi:transposase, IS5 family